MTIATRPTTDADRRELLDSLHPNATRVRQMLTELVSDDGMRISDHGRRKYTYDAFRRAQRAAVRMGFIVERLPAGPHRRMRNVIVQRWDAPYRDGVVALLDWAGEADLDVAAALADARSLDATPGLLSNLAREPSLAVLLPPRPLGSPELDKNTPIPWQSWFESANAIMETVTA